jgi:dTDP-4-dehydrorhamnose reductase
MIVLILGGGGMLGHKLVQVLSPRMDVFTTLHHSAEPYKEFGIFDPEKTLERIDILNEDDLSSVFRRIQPDVVVNAVGLIKQMVGPRDVIKPLSINSIFPHRLAKLAGRHKARVISISTDCVFDGAKGNYTEKDTPSATDLYGISKRFGELEGENCLTIRTSMVGRELTGKRSLLEWFLSMKGKTIKGYTSAIFSGLPTVVLAELIETVITDHPKLDGIFHVSSEPISKHDLLELFNKAFDAEVAIQPTDEIKIDRSLDSSKFRSMTGIDFPPMPVLIDRMASDPTPYDN